MLQARYQKYTLRFKQPSGTSRGVLHTKDSWFIFLTDTEQPEKVGIGECGLLKGLSIDDRPDYESQLMEVCRTIERHGWWLSGKLAAFPSIQFGLEMAIKDLTTGAKRLLHPSPFTQSGQSIPINGLVWMGSKEFMFEQIKSKLHQGFTCIKLKIGAIDFEAEISLLRYIRQQFSPSEIEIRADANGAFTATEALDKLKQLSEFHLHSIEQPIRQGQWDKMAELCEKTPLPVALDEELINIHEYAQKEQLLTTIQPQYLIFKPSLIGGYRGTREWITLCQKWNIPWWITSALESNIGLNAIAQWTATLGNPMPQGLGTGQLYTNNFPSPLTVQEGHIFHKKNMDWDLSKLGNPFK